MTETQPDPQVVAWMRGYLRDRPGISQYAAVLAGTAAFRRGAFPRLVTSWDLAAAYDEAARKPLAETDIPAGQGPASLFLRRLGRSGQLVAWYRANDVETIAFMREPEPHAGPAERALWEHLAATLPTVTREETP